MTQDEFLIAVVDEFNRSTRHELHEKLNHVMRSGSIDTESLDLVTAKAFVASYFEYRARLLTPPIWSSHYHRFKGTVKKFSIYI